MGALNFAPSHGLFVNAGVVGDDAEVNSGHRSSSGDGALVGFAIEGLLAPLLKYLSSSALDARKKLGV